MSRLTRQIQKTFPELAGLTLLAACDVIAQRFVAQEGPGRVKFGRTHQEFYMAHAAYASHIEEHFHRRDRDSVSSGEPVERAKPGAG